MCVVLRSILQAPGGIADAISYMYMILSLKKNCNLIGKG